MLNLKTKFGRKVWKHIREEYVVWLTTLGPDGAPHPRPVWFVWDQGDILIYSEPTAYKVKHIRKHKKVALHFNTDPKGEEDVVILLGEAHVDKSAPPAHKQRAYLKKYSEGILGLNMSPERFGQEYSAAIRITLHAMRGW